MPDAHYTAVQNGAPPPDPYHPDTLPVGSSVLFTSSDFTGTEFGARYNAIRAQCGVDASDGTATLIERTGPDTVRVTIGPTQSMENSFAVGVGVGPVSVGAGNTQSLNTAQLQTVEFNINTPEGLAAYNTFLETGQLPAQEGPGITHRATIQTVAYDSTTGVSAALGPWDGELTLSSTQIDQRRVSYPDGSSELVTELDYGTSVPVTLQQHFDANGVEDVSQQRITLDLGDMDPTTASYFYEAFTGDAAGAQAIREGDSRDVTITLTHDQAQQLQTRVSDYLAAHGGSVSPIALDTLLRGIATASSPEVAAARLGSLYGSVADLGFAFLNIVADSASDGVADPLPGTLTLEPPLPPAPAPAGG